MLGGIDAAHVYIVCGYTDMRRSIDGLAAIIKQNFGCNPYDGIHFQKVCFFSAERKVIVLKVCSGMKMVFSCCTKDWITDDFNGLVLKQKFNLFLMSSLYG